MTRADPGRSSGRLPPRNERNPFWRLKVRLQFTGWLQYIIVALAALPFLLLAAVSRLTGAWPLVLFWPPAAVGSLLLFLLAFDLVTVKLGVRPAEGVPRPREGMDAFDLMRSRRSCRSFQPRNLTDAHRAALAESVSVRTRSGLIGDRPIRFEYVAERLSVWPSVGGHEFLVAIAPHEYDRTAVIDVGRSLQRVVIDATRLGIATCWIGPEADHESIVAHLGDRFDPGRDHIICVCAVGYRSRFKPLFVRFMEAMQHRRLPLARLFYADADFRTPLDVEAPPFDSFGRCYEVCRWSPSSFNSQTTRCVGVESKDGGAARAARFDFYAATPSRYYAAVALGIWCADWEAGCEALGIPGHFAVLAPGERGAGGAIQALPRYDVSWVADSE